MMGDLKYVAAGFLDDADNLLRDFMKENSLEFSVFTGLWKKHCFSLIYACRPNVKELREFTLEIFHLSMTFLESEALLYQVGGTFLLYALYRNQILSPPLKIRITLTQFKIISALQDVSRAEKHRSLHYVITYLIENAFDFVAYSKLKGPNSIKNELFKDVQRLKILESDLKLGLTEIAQTNVLHEIDDLYTQYEKNIQSLNSPFLNIDSKHPSFKEFALEIDDLLNEGRTSDDEETDTNADPVPMQPKASKTLKNFAIGSRRALIKAAAFSNPVYHYMSHEETSCVTDGIESAVEVPTKPSGPAAIVRKKRHVRKGRRKVGRPKKLPFERLLSVEPTPANSIHEKSPERRRRPRGPQFTKIRHYYSEDFADCDLLELPSTSSYLPDRVLFSSDGDSSEQY